ncbi:MAG: metallophosphatase domain-containing protein [Bacteroidales bacterium]|nr:metallophosphatase domain-containing protein [Bacteroidales bacterium]
MRIVHISDTHGRHREIEGLPEGDVIVHSGDFTNMGTEEEVLDFLNWMVELPHRHKIFVPGNHDFCLLDAEGVEELPEGLHFLSHHEVEIEGVKFFGLGYMQDPRRIPEGVGVLITHEPPAGVLSTEEGIGEYGSEEIREAVWRLRPRVHLFGHCHSGYGLEEHNGIIFSNGAMTGSRCEKIENEGRVIEV